MEKDIPVSGLQALPKEQLNHVAVTVVQYLFQELGRTVEEICKVAGFDDRVQLFV